MKVIRDQIINSLGEAKSLIKEKENETPEEKETRLKRLNDLIKSSLYLVSQL